MDSGEAATPKLVTSFIRRFRTEILAEWRRGARQLPIASNLSPVALVDHIPELLDEVADIAAEIVSSSHGVRTTFETANEHALDRLAEGFDVATVVHELSLLRAAVLTVWSREEAGQDVTGLHAIDLAIDRAIAASVRRFIEVHERTLAGIDRISTASFESSNVDDFMHRLLRVFMETTPAVNTAAILLLDGDVLRMRASVGLEGVESATVALGEGFSGTIAATRQPLALRSAYLDPRVNSVVRDQMIRALYGVPLIHEDRLIGVAHMGSLTAHELSHEDRQFFGSMAARATVGIVHHVLRQELADSELRFRQLAAAAERALAELESLLAASPVGIAFVDRELRYLRINDALARLNGLPASEHLGRPIRDILPPEAADQLEPVLRDLLATGKPVLGLEVTVRTSAGEPKHLLVNYFPVQSAAGDIFGIGAVIVDVTPLAQTREALRLEQQRIQSILEHAPAAIWVKDPGGRVVLANHRLAAALGADFQDLIGRRSAELLPPDFAAEHEEHDALVLREQRSIEVEETVPSPDGDRTFLSVKFPIPGTPPLVGGIATEITQRKRMEEELRVAVRTREDVLAVVSHDLRSPLQTVQLSATMLLTQLASDPRSRRHLEMIQRACVRMEKLIEDLLDTASIREGRLQLVLAPEAVESILAEALDLYTPLAAERGIEVTGDRAGVEGLELACDRNRILQVIGNLTSNAIKFCRPGDTIQIRARRDGDRVVFSVTDSGPGIDAQVLPFLFDPYWSGTGTAKAGAGLGLYIVRGIVERHGGEVAVESEVGRGTTFTFSLPIA